MLNYYSTQLPAGGKYMTEKEYKEIQEADLVYKAIYHPDTKEKVPYIFRMCAFVPVNLPIVFGMICTKQTLFNVILWQWVNQSYNAGWNYSNRNATSPFTQKELAIAYSGAVTASISVALVGRKLNQKYGITSGAVSKLRFVNGLVTLCALSTAGFLNLFLIRMNEMKKGISVVHEGVDHGLSQKAARKAVITSGLTRCVLPIPLTMVVPLCWKITEMIGLAPKGAKGIIALDLLFLVVSMTVSLPMAISLFSQNLKVAKEDLEPKFHNLKDSKGAPITHFLINKGL